MDAKSLGLSTVTMRATTGGIFQKFMKAIRPDDDYDNTPDLIKFALSNPCVDIALVGMRTVSEVRANIEVEAGDRLDLDAIHRKFYT
jgi:aryl-alcohol dehydrogenase-like predicted oxidoreductase